ncbi:efflux RND transporter periplasmic adaptor subunit [Staphylococcus simulans]
MSLLLLSATAVGLYAAFRHHTLQANQNVKTYTATYNKPIQFSGIQSAETTQSFYYDAHLGVIHDWYGIEGKMIQKEQPLFEYYNKTIEQRLTAIRKQLNALDSQQHRQNYLSLHHDLEQEYDRLQLELRTQIFSMAEGIVHIIDKYPSQKHQLFAQIHSSKRVIKAYISETDLKPLKLNQTVEIKTQTTDRFKGKILSISHFPDVKERQSSMSYYEVQISTNGVMPVGTHVHITIPTHLIALPKDVLYEKNAVLIKKNEQTVKRIIKYHEKSGMVIISEGLLPGEKVIAQPKNFTLN